MSRGEDVEALNDALARAESLAYEHKPEWVGLMQEARAEVARLSGERDELRGMVEDREGYRRQMEDAVERAQAAEGERERLREALEDTDVWLDSLIKSGWAAQFIEGAKTRQRLNRAALSAGAEQEGETRARDRDTRDGACTCQKNGWNPDCPRHGRTQ